MKKPGHARWVTMLPRGGEWRRNFAALAYSERRLLTGLASAAEID